VTRTGARRAGSTARALLSAALLIVATAGAGCARVGAPTGPSSTGEASAPAPAAEATATAEATPGSLPSDKPQPPRLPPGPPVSASAARRYLRVIMPDSLLRYAHLEVASTRNVTVRKEGGGSLGLGLEPGQPRVSNGIRAEAAVDFPFKQGDTVRYTWRFMLPEDFVSDAPLNRFWIVAQWHDQPDRRVGETWKELGPHPPPVSLGLQGAGDGLLLDMTYGFPEAQRLGPVPIERGRWYTVSVVVHWSMKEDGWAKMYVHDMRIPAVLAEGRNMRNDVRHYFKVGMYRDPGIEVPDWIFVADVRIERVR
jgi:hypothetical protein